MNAREGTRRMRKAGRVTCAVGTGSFVLFAGLQMMFDRLHNGGQILFAVIYISLPIVAFGTALWIAAYIVEGFYQDTSSV